MTWKAPSDEQNWSYLGYLASNVRSVLIPMVRNGGIQLEARDLKYLNQGKKFFEAAVAGCSSYAEPTKLFSVQEQNVPPAANALRIAVDIYNEIHATPPPSLESFAGTLRTYADTLRAVCEYGAIPDEFRASTDDLIRFLQAMVEKATTERYREFKHDFA